jgi:hypothetical protein
MNDDENRKLVENFLGAFAHLMTGDPERREAFLLKVNIVVHHTPANMATLLQFAEPAREQNRPYLWIVPHHHADMMHSIGLMTYAGESMFAVESCFPWLDEDGKSGWLLTDNMHSGVFKFDDAMMLRRIVKSPVKDFDAAMPGIGRAFKRLAEIEAEQLQNEDGFKAPRVLALS